METSCCPFGEELKNKKNVLLESENFFIVPALGQMGIEGYLLLCSKKHYIGVSSIPKNLEGELEEMIGRVKKSLKKIYNTEVVVFEHGPKTSCSKGGGCLDHAHLHIIPLKIDIIRYLSKIFKLKLIRSFTALKRVVKKTNTSYIYIESSAGKRYVISVEVPLPSQYLRRVIASLVGISCWDWKKNSDFKTFQKTIRSLRRRL